MMAKITYEVKRIGVFSVVKTLFLLGGFSGFVFGLLEWGMVNFIWWAGQNAPVQPGLFGQPGAEELLGDAIGVVGIILPFIGAIGGAVSGVIGGFVLTGLYNLGARIWGGFEVQLESSSSAPDQALPLGPSRPGEATPLPGEGPAGPAEPSPPKRDDNGPPSRPSAAMFE
jgi:hypothetical protein